MDDCFLKAFIFFFCILFVEGSVIRNSAPITNTTKSNNTTSKRTLINRNKRSFDFTGGLAMGFGAYDYYNYYGDLVSDYSYDYYDWICSETSCQLCDVLTSECCDPDVDVNCFLPDTCFNNPCLSGGTCITSRTVDDRPDFTCVCLPGLTGKYCQLVNDYFLGAERLAIALMNAPSVLGGLGGIGLNIPLTQGAPPIPPALAVLSEINNRLGPPPPPGPENPGGSGPQPNQKMPSEQQSDKNAPVNAQNNHANAHYQNQYSPSSQPYQPKSNQAYLSKPKPQDSSQSATNVNPDYQNPSFLAQNHPGGVQRNKKLKPNAGLNVLGAKRVKCPEGQMFNGEKGECAEFTLKKNKEKSSEEKLEKTSE